MVGSGDAETGEATGAATRVIGDLSQATGGFGAVVFDQWGVLHDGSAPSASAIAALERLRAEGRRLAVLSNSGKRAEANAAQLARLGFSRELFEVVMTSGEALWRAFAAGEFAVRRLCAITRGPGDAEAWAEGLDLAFGPVESAEAVLLMGLADAAPEGAHDAVLGAALERGLPLLCSNPDRSAPRAGGVTVVMPGTLAKRYAEAGGAVVWIGKPHGRVFRSVEAALDLDGADILMVGDSLEHDIAGAAAAGWRSAFIAGGLHAAAFAGGITGERVAALARALAAPPPDFTLDMLR